MTVNIIPYSPRPYPVNIISNVELVDYNRADPFAPRELGPQPRRVMVTVYQPLVDAKFCLEPSLINYMPPAIAEFYNKEGNPKGMKNGSLASLRLQNCDVIPPAPQKAPLLLFSPGLSASRFEYGVILQAVASSGYTIVSMDHTYDSDAVQFSNGSIIYGVRSSFPPNITLPELVVPLTVDLAVRVPDVQFVLDQIRAHNVTGLQSQGLDCDNVGIFGHSLGGATAVGSLVNITRLKGAVNYDGTMVGPILTEHVDKPVLLLDALGHNQSQDFTWYDVWENLHGWGLQLELNPSLHWTFMDTSIIATLLNESLPSLLGPNPLDGLRVLEILRAYTVAFFDFVLKGEGEGLLKGPSPKFPEIIFQNRTGNITS